jgi:hypothetical protein
MKTEKILGYLCLLWAGGPEGEVAQHAWDDLMALVKGKVAVLDKPHRAVNLEETDPDLRDVSPEVVDGINGCIYHLIDYQYDSEGIENYCFRKENFSASDIVSILGMLTVQTASGKARFYPSPDKLI